MMVMTIKKSGKWIGALGMTVSLRLAEGHGSKCEFSKFVISRLSDKAFQELSFKKMPQKVLFQCKGIGR